MAVELVLPKLVVLTEGILVLAHGLVRLCPAADALDELDSTCFCCFGVCVFVHADARTLHSRGRESMRNLFSFDTSSRGAVNSSYIFATKWIDS